MQRKAYVNTRKGLPCQIQRIPQICKLDSEKEIQIPCQTAKNDAVNERNVISIINLHISSIYLEPNICLKWSTLYRKQKIALTDMTALCDDTQAAKLEKSETSMTLK